MINLDGKIYTLKSVEENLSDLVIYINKYCTDNNIVNSKGEPVVIEINPSNILYIILRGVAYLITGIQKLMYACGCAFNIPNSSDTQLLNLADIARIKRKKATNTIIPCTIYSSLSTDDVPSDCIITTSLSVTLNVGGQTVIFHPAFDVTIPMSSSKNIPLIAESLGSFNITEGSITSFDTPVAGLRKIVSEASIPGQNEETIQALRQRMQEHFVNNTPIDKCAEAIQELPGVSLCNIFFNFNYDIPLSVGSIQVPPRKALLLVQGFSTEIAKTFYKYLLCETAGQDYENAIPQVYTNNAAQQLTVYIVPPETVTVYIRLYIGKVIDDVLIQKIKDSIMLLSRSLTIGQSLTSAEVLSQVSSLDNTLPLQGCNLSFDGLGYSYKVTPEVNKLIVFDFNKIDIIGENID